MGAALSIFVLLSLSVFVIRIASVALRVTGLSDSSARFQALSAYSGTGFTTSEAETIVNYPVRRRIISLLMIIGNVGLVTVFATVVVSLVHTEGNPIAVVKQLVWLLSGLAALWFLMLNKTADRFLCYWIGVILESTTILGQRGFHRLLQIGDGFSVCEHPVPAAWITDTAASLKLRFDDSELVLLAIRSPGGENLTSFVDEDSVSKDHALVLFGPDHEQESFVPTSLQGAQ